MLTNKGLNEINSSMSDAGILLEISHYVAVFDQQLDDDYENGLVAQYSHIGNYTDPVDEVPTGLVYWKSVPTTDTAPLRTDVYPDVTYQPVTNTNTDPANYKGTWLVSSGAFPTGASDGEWWTVSGDGTVEDIYFADGNTLAYDGVAGAFTNASALNKRANFKATITADPINPVSPGSMRVNKIAVYGSRRAVDGAFQGDDVFLVGQVIIPDGQLIQDKEGDDSFGLDTLIVDFQIDTQAVTVDFENILYATPNDYWTRVTNGGNQYGLAYDGQVFIANRLGVEDINAEFPSADDVGVGKLFVSTFQTVNSTPVDGEADLPQLVLQYVKSNEYGTSNSSAFSPRIRTTFRTTPDGDCEVNLYGSCSNEFEYYSFVPQYDGEFGLGNNSNRWKSVQSSESMTVYLGEEYLYTGSTPNKDGRWYEIQQDSSSPCAKDSYGFMVLRNNDLSDNVNLGLGYFGNASVYVGPHYDIRDKYTSVFGVRSLTDKENHFYAYGNISNPMACAVDSDGTTKYFESYNLDIRSTKNMSLFTISDDYKSSYEFGSDFGGGDIHAATYDGLISALITNGHRGISDEDDSVFVQGFVQNTIYKMFYRSLFWEGINEGQDLSTLQDVRDSLFNGSGGLQYDVNILSTQYINTFGDIVPMVDRLNDLGSSDSTFRKIYTRTLVGGLDAYDGTNVRSVVVDGNVVPVSPLLALGSSEDRWGYMHTSQIDVSVEGYINNLTSETLTVGSDLGLTIENNFMYPTYTDYDLGSIGSDFRSLYVRNIYATYLNGIDITNGLVSSYSKTYVLKNTKDRTSDRTEEEVMDNGDIVYIVNDEDAQCRALYVTVNVSQILGQISSMTLTVTFWSLKNLERVSGNSTQDVADIRLVSDLIFDACEGSIPKQNILDHYGSDSLFLTQNDGRDNNEMSGRVTFVPGDDTLEVKLINSQDTNAREDITHQGQSMGVIKIV